MTPSNEPAPDPPAWPRWTAAAVAGLYWLAMFLGTHWPKLPLPQGGRLGWDKVLHFSGFAGLAVLLAFAVSRWRDVTVATYVVIVVVLAAYGAVDEWTQALVPGRSCDLYDWLADMAGMTLGLMIFALGAWLFSGGQRTD